MERRSRKDRKRGSMWTVHRRGALYRTERSGTGLNGEETTVFQAVRQEGLKYKNGDLGEGRRFGRGRLGENGRERASARRKAKEALDIKY